jgi:Ca-activated chloride channel homolog
MSTPRINPNDPQWTAFVLGEFESDRDAVEHLLDASPEARALVDDLKVTSAAIEQALENDEPLQLTPAQRAAVRRASEAETPSALAWLRLRWAATAAAAVVAVAIIAVILLRPSPSSSPAQMAMAEPFAASSPSTAPADGSASATAAPAIIALPPATRPPATDRSVASSPSTAAPTIAAQPAAPPIPGASTTTLSGTVRDVSGSILPGVTIEAMAVGSGARLTTNTDAQGQYSFGSVDPAQTYHVTAALPGFTPATGDFQAGSSPRDFSLSVGSLAESVSVTGTSPVIDKQSTSRQVAGLVPPPAGALAAAPAPPAAPVASPQAAAGRFDSFAGNIVGGVTGGSVGGVAGATANRTVVDGARFRTPTTGTESYTAVVENSYIRASQEPLATFSIDVDTASYSNVRRFLNQGQLPPRDAVRIEELINYFTYAYPSPSGDRPIAASIAATAAPWNPQHRLVRIGVKARQIDAARRPASNLVFLIDVSGSMNMPQKLPLLKSALKLLVDQIGENDTVSIVTYAGGTRVALTPTSGDRKDVIARTIDDLQAGGSTNGSAGIQLAYREAAEGFIRGGTNRVILMTDGDFNVGISDAGELTRLIEQRAKSGVFLSVLGFGMGNLKDSTMERLADKGNGHYAYIDTLAEARKVLVEQMTGTLVTIAKDVKIQVDFNPAKVEAYRLIGYENRALRPEDFNDDRKDAGEMGAGHTVTALFEIVPRGGEVPGGSIDPSVFQPAPRPAAPPTSRSNDLLVLRLRYKLPEASESTRMDVPFADRSLAFARADDDFRFAAAVAAFGMLLKDSPYKGDATLDWVRDTAAASQGKDHGGYRDEFVSLVQKAIALSARTRRVPPH